MTIDAPYTCCWCWALVLAHRAIFRGAGWAWPACGLVVGLGILAKYTMVVFPPSLFLYLLTTPVHRRLLARPGFWVMCAAGAACCLPIVVWNVEHGWIGFYHVESLGGLRDPRLYWTGPLSFVAGQAALLLVFWFVCWVWAMVEHNPLRDADPDRRFLWWLSAPVFVLFLLFGFKTGGGELNWPVTAYLSGMALTAPWLARRLTETTGWVRGVTVGGLAAACACGLALTLVIHFSHWLHPLMGWVCGPPSGDNPLPVRRYDPSCRLRGWRHLAAEIDALRDLLRRETGKEPVIAGSCWALPGELGFYCAGHPQAFSLGEKLNDRCSQYDIWDGPVRQPEKFRGRTFIVVNLMGHERELLRPAFARLDKARVVMHEEGGYPVSAWSLTVCRGYRGFDQPPATARRHRKH
jgi:hypothetical protein